ncbi:MAG: YggS family pyridoxal phosphate-dependent enzyme [Chlamydiales bacterium]|nr:YggS family pyridoxal phosphate-dependent enzyme [Chlamydiales bacterium]
MTHYREVKKKVDNALALVGKDPSSVCIIAVSKGQSVDKILEAYNEGCRDFAENRVQELLEKRAFLPEDIRWHFTGTLQKNKVNKVVGAVALIHAVDTQELLEKIAEISRQKNLLTHVFLQVNISGEGTKHGLSILEWEKILDKCFLLENVSIDGLMTMAPKNADPLIIKECFADLKHTQEYWKQKFQRTLAFLSMGMSSDFVLALQEGASHIRIGSLIFQEEV